MAASIRQRSSSLPLIFRQCALAPPQRLMPHTAAAAKFWQNYKIFLLFILLGAAAANIWQNNRFLYFTHELGYEIRVLTRAPLLDHFWWKVSHEVRKRCWFFAAFNGNSLFALIRSLDYVQLFISAQHVWRCVEYVEPFFFYEIRKR